MNSINLIGNLTHTPDLRQTPNSNAVANFTIAVGDGFGDKQKTYFIPCVVWGKQAEALAQYNTKGNKIAVSGKIVQRSYENKDGEKRSIIEVLVDKLVFLTQKKAAEITETEDVQF